MTFDIEKARQAAIKHSTKVESEIGLIESFSQVCKFLSDNPDRLSWKSKKNQPSVCDDQGLDALARKYFLSYRKSDFPVNPGTVPDEMVSIVMQEAYRYSADKCKQIKIEHQHAMCAENCVGALLERYIDSKLRVYGWHWCCGDFVKAIDFVRKNENGEWLALQIKNRDNSENSSSSAIRNGTPIKKWFRSYSKTGLTNWDNMPESMKGYDLSEEGFILFVRQYLSEKRPN